ncbi:hypothetical protein GCM10010178_92060 [Lentzea flava]|uniref:Uncharacterized protein n=1 Tax=Lentzea flava TaxID=103732 RepID=A0ABQ2VI01_9PSEU|nr:hypothetical protein [Lentzea flava]GGU87992.1 hypothetical protein GCM10010178_92060 [Lentzea flava]
MDAAKAKMIPSIQQDALILERIKCTIHSFLVTTECELDEGQQDAPLFLRAQEYINTPWPSTRLQRWRSSSPLRTASTAERQKTWHTR